jgi:hypothetical protein
VSAQEYAPPIEIAVTPLDSPETSTGNREFVVVLFPNWPFELLPQHFTPPSDVSAHECELPDETTDTPLVNPETSTGVLRFVNELSPS